MDQGWDIRLQMLGICLQTCAKFFIVSQGAKLYKTLRKFASASALASKCRHSQSFDPHSRAEIRIQIRTTILKSAFKSAKLCKNQHPYPQNYNDIYKSLWNFAKLCTTLQNPQPDPQNYAEIRIQIRTAVHESVSASACANFSVAKSASASAFTSASANFRIIFVRKFWK